MEAHAFVLAFLTAGGAHCRISRGGTLSGLAKSPMTTFLLLQGAKRCSSFFDDNIVLHRVAWLELACISGGPVAS